MPIARLAVILFCSCDLQIAYLWPALTSACCMPVRSSSLSLRVALWSLFQVSTWSSEEFSTSVFQLNPSFLTGSSIFGLPRSSSVYVPFHVFRLIPISIEDPLHYSPSQLAYTQNPLQSPRASVTSSSFTPYRELNKFSPPSHSIAWSKPNHSSSALL